MAREAGIAIKVTLPSRVVRACEAEAERRCMSLSGIIRERLERSRERLAGHGSDCGYQRGGACDCWTSGEE